MSNEYVTDEQWEENKYLPDITHELRGCIVK